MGDNHGRMHLQPAVTQSCLTKAGRCCKYTLTSLPAVLRGIEDFKAKGFNPSAVQDEARKLADKHLKVVTFPSHHILHTTTLTCIIPLQVCAQQGTKGCLVEPGHTQCQCPTCSWSKACAMQDEVSHPCSQNTNAVRISCAFLLLQGLDADESTLKDQASHFVLRLAYCRTEDLRRWFLGQESELFRARFSAAAPASQVYLLMRLIPPVCCSLFPFSPLASDSLSSTCLMVLYYSHCTPVTTPTLVVMVCHQQGAWLL